jgi:hypothetical protein
MDHFAIAWTEVPFYSYLFALCSRSIEEAWIIQRDVAGDKKNCALSSLGWKRV